LETNVSEDQEDFSSKRTKIKKMEKKSDAGMPLFTC
jgi:hypothetical protein